MITFEITFMALIDKEDGNTGARIAFPKQGHALEINGRKVAPGTTIRLEVRKNGQLVNLKTPKRMPLGGRTLSIRHVVGGGPYRLRPDSQLLASNGPAQAVLHLHGGEFEPKDPKTSSKYADDAWDIGGGRTQQITDHVVWKTAPLADHEYVLDVGGRKTTLASGDVVEFKNDDDPPNEFKPNSKNEIVMEDAAELYKLVTPGVPSNPRLPKTTPKLGTFEAGGDLPLCPVGEP